ncbi:MAG: O-antigen ligase family protein [Myxococcaceae bacterium]|nr:O-antigen ligase family protein [Myxococcaceae bacterium]
MTRAHGFLAAAVLTFLPFARDAFELPHLVVLLAGALVVSGRLTRVTLAVFSLGSGAALLSLATSSAPALGVPGFVTLVGVMLFASSAAQLDWRPVVWASVPVAGWALVQAAGLDVFEWEDVARWCGGLRPFATLGHPTQLGVWMGALTVLALDVARRRRAVGLLVVAALTALVCLSTLSRAGWLTLVVGGGTWLALLGRSSRLTRAQVLRFAGVAAGVGLLAAVLVGGAALVERVVNLFVAPTRLALWRTALAGFSQHPWLGWGFDTFVLVDQQLRQPEAWKYEWGGTALHAHALPAQVLATQGLVGAALLIVASALVLRAWWKGRAVTETPAELAVVVALAVASLVTFHGVLVLALFFSALARTLDEPTAPARAGWVRWLAAPVLVVALVMLAASVSGRRGVSAEGYAHAAQLEPWSPTWSALQGEVHELDGRLPEARAAYDEGLRRAPLLAVSHANVGRVASKQGDAATSHAAFERARRLAPLDARIALDAADASVRLADLDLAGKTLELLVRTYPSDGPAWLALGRVRLLEGKKLEARAMLQTSLAVDWRDWPEGMGLARQLLSAVLLDAGEVDAALLVAGGPASASLAKDVCGAPAKLR